MAGFKDFVNGAILTEADLDDYLAKQAAMKMATAAARDAALTGAFKREGMIVVQDDTNCIMVSRDATAGNYSTVGPVHGALTAWTPTLTQSGSVAFTATRSVYQRIGRKVWFQTKLVSTAAGSAGVAISVTLPVAAALSDVVGGTGYVYDASLPGIYFGQVYLASTTTFQLLNSLATTVVFLGASGFTAALATNDVINVTGEYEAAADA